MSQDIDLPKPAPGDMTMLGWCDLAGLVRCRAVPSSQLDDVREDGVGWTAAGQAILPFGGIAENPWGPMDEVRQLPVGGRAYLPRTATAATFDLVLTQSRDASAVDWSCCPRAFCAGAFADLERETGWTFVSAYEFEFTRLDDARASGRPVYTLDAMRASSTLLEASVAALSQAGLDPRTIEPEFGAGQLEIALGASRGLEGVDRGVLAREVLREVARREGATITLSPKPTPEAVGNGQHVHFSFVDAEGRPALYDAARPALLSEAAASFAAGIMAHAPALCAIAAPSPVSYLRLGPGHWSCGYASFGFQNREAMLRVCPPASREEARRAAALNLEYRPPDALSNPHLVTGMLVRAGLDGIRHRLPLPPMVAGDPANLTAEERDRLGISPLPGSLAEALEALVADEVACGWLPSDLLAAFLAIKRAELARFADADPDEVCSVYSSIY
ncbi:glutamine synthetase family protein [Sphingomonas sp. CCH18-H6]|uniref:glutamine synthetase family protein n=1 Tax=Sphingomonas sp. CCH18-H6 TaxID=1768787 RepID=UPI000834FCA2|nr:glutamine synthetase family protein [Sphingomonas sp. CCH18-H6]